MQRPAALSRTQAETPHKQRAHTALFRLRASIIMEDGKLAVVNGQKNLTATVNMTDDSLLSSGSAFDPTQPSSVNEVDGWIELLMSCKQLSENDVMRLCEKVSTTGV